MPPPPVAPSPAGPPDAPVREQRSLFGEILDWMLAPVLLLWPLSVALTWLLAQSIANRPYDRELAVLARGVARQVQIVPAADGVAPEVRLRRMEVVTELTRGVDGDPTVWQVLGARGELVAGDPTLPVPEEPAAPPEEMRWRDERMQGDAVRVAYLWLPAASGTGTGPLVQVAQTRERRAQLATEIIKGVVFPQFVVLPLAVLLVWMALARGIRPLSQLQQRIRNRESHDLAPLPERDVPEEVAPLVSSINDLLSRLDRSITVQKRFLADAAHQLKTPLAGLKMQAELAQRELEAGPGGVDAPTLTRTLTYISQASERAAHMVNQLLAMARAEGRAPREPELVRLVATVHETVHDFLPKAMDKRIDLGYEGPDDDDELRGRLLGQPLLVRELVRNLVDNALQYTPAGGTVTVRVIDDPFGQVQVLQVEDTGPGIPEAERTLVLEPFYRALGTQVDGSGLGLAIVDEISRQHGARLSIDDARNRAQAQAMSQANGHAVGVGALLTVRFPVQPTLAASAVGPQAAELSSIRPESQPSILGK